MTSSKKDIEAIFAKIDALGGADFLPEGRPPQPPMPQAPVLDWPGESDMPPFESYRDELLPPCENKAGSFHTSRARVTKE